MNLVIVIWLGKTSKKKEETRKDKRQNGPTDWWGGKINQKLEFPQGKIHEMPLILL